MSIDDVLRKKEDFDRLYRNRPSGSRYVVVFSRKNGLAYNRKAFLASKKVGDSVRRNRAKRLMKEAFRQMEGFLPQGYDLLFVARNTITEDHCKCADVKKSMEAAIQRAGIRRAEEKQGEKP